MFHKQAFLPEEYDKGITRTLPYYEEYFKQIIDIVRTGFSASIDWLDIGCGTGKMADAAMKNSQVRHMICCDISPKMLKTAKERVDSSCVEFLEMSAQGLQYHAEFDVVTAILLHHYFSYEDRLVSIKNCYKALKKNGFLFTVENFAPSNDRIKNLYLQRWKSYQYNNGKSEKECQEHILRYNTEYFPIPIQEQIEIFRKCGFENVEIFWCSYMQVGILGIK